MLCPICNNPKAHKHGTDRQGYQRWKCPKCGHTWPSNPNPGKAGRKPLGDAPMSPAERKRRQRNKPKG